MGETAADYLNDTLGSGLNNTALLMSALLVVALILQFRARRHVPSAYWTAVVLITVAHLKLGLNAVLASWMAYVLTRPLGASIGVGMSQPTSAGGLGLGTTGTSVLFLGVILALVVFLAVTKVDQTEPMTSVQSDPDDEPDKVGV